MGDIRTSHAIIRSRLKVNIESLRLNVSKIDLRQLELQEEISKLDENRSATLKSIADLDKQLSELKED